MIDKRVRITFISHDASRTGAPILLLTILGWLQRNRPCEITTILLMGGEMESAFKGFGPTLLIEKGFKSPLLRLIYRLVKNRASMVHNLLQSIRLKRFIKNINPDVIYANTVVSLAFASKNGLTGDRNVLCHVHELAYIIDNFVGREVFRRSVGTIQNFICVSQVHKRNLIDYYGVSDHGITVIPEPIQIEDSAVYRDLRSELGIDADAFVILGAGTTDWRKGPDLFLMTACLVNRIRPGVRFIWVGSLPESRKKMFDHDIEKLKLGNTVQFIGSRPNPMEYFAMANVFYLPSREDPYPLVCLEAASLGKPIICFADAGGMPEFVREDAGYVVKFMDLEAATDCIVKLYDDRDLGWSLGEVAKERVTRESDIGIVGPKIWKVIAKTLTQN